MGRRHSTLYLSGMRESNSNRKYQAEYTFYDRHYKKWFGDVRRFDSVEEVTEWAKSRKMLIK